MTRHSPHLSPQQLADAATVLLHRAPNAELVRNPVGNLAIIQDGQYLGWLDTLTGEVSLFADEPEHQPSE